MKTYWQFCPIARASEVIAERWTPIILRNLLQGCTTFNEIAAGAPMISRALLTKRLHELERAGVIEITPKPDGRGSRYQPTVAGRELWAVLMAMGGWAEKWMEVTPEHSDPDIVLWSWCTGFLRRDLLPGHRVVVRFEFANPLRASSRGKVRVWLLVQDRDGELCARNPGFEEDLVVSIQDPHTFALWHLGRVEWGDALGAGAITVSGPPELARALPTWNAGPQIHVQGRKEHAKGPNLLVTPHLDPGTGPPMRADGGSVARGSDSIPGFRGWVLRRGDSAYERARRVWNGAIDRHPAVIANCHGPDDVAAALRFARQRDLPVAVRGGGHSVAGWSVRDDGIVIDLSMMKTIEVDPVGRTARAGAGLRWGEFDTATQAFGLATTGGVHSRTGIGGLTLGGGIGHLMRRHGLTVDNLLSADVVLADGERVVASEREHADLFWGLRGGGGGLGIVTSFTYRLHPVGPDILAGSVLWRMEDAAEVLRRYREFAAAAPRELSTAVILRKAPMAPYLPVDLHRRPVCMVAVVHIGDPHQAEEVLAPMRSFGRPLFDMVAPRPYTAVQSMLNASAQDGWHYSWKSANLRSLEEGTVDALVAHASRLRSPLSYAFLAQLGGAVADVPADATAYAHRTAAFNLNVNAVWMPHQAIGESESTWAREFLNAVEPWQQGAYINFLDRDDAGRMASAFGETTYARLRELRRRYDPDGVFDVRDPAAVGVSPS
jgi:FAD/FMN-containing dehydrogenase/DNA-binding HxlR family transcriptional regulator